MVKILCYGSLNIDHVYNVDHFVRQGETIKSLRLEDYCGGKGLNQSISLAKAGALVYHAGNIGEDGVFLKEKLQANNVNVDFVRSKTTAPTGHAIIQINPQGQNCILTHAGANHTIEEAEIDETIRYFGPGDILLIQNEINKLDYLLRSAHVAGMRIALNPSPIDLVLKSSNNLKFVDWFIMNELEGYEFTGCTNPEDICLRMSENYPNARTVLTLGEKGCLYFDKKRFISQKSFQVTAVDTTAAGDTFTGYFLAGVTHEEDIEDVLVLASGAAAITVTRVGAADSIPFLSEVECFLNLPLLAK